MSKARSCSFLITRPRDRGGYTISHECGKPTRHPSGLCHLHRERPSIRGGPPHLAPVAGSYS